MKGYTAMTASLTAATTTVTAMTVCLGVTAAICHHRGAGIPQGAEGEEAKGDASAHASAAG